MDIPLNAYCYYCNNVGGMDVATIFGLNGQYLLMFNRKSFLFEYYFVLLRFGSDMKKLQLRLYAGPKGTWWHCEQEKKGEGVRA